MLNELYQVACALDKAGVKSGYEWHKHMQPFPKAKTIRLWLSKDGMIDDRIDVIDEAATAALRKYAPTKFFSVPAMNINYLTGYEGEKKHSEDERKKDIETEIGKVVKGLRLLVKQSTELRNRLGIEKGTLWFELLSRLSSVEVNLFRERFEQVLAQNTIGFSFAPNKSVHVIFDLLDYENFGAYPIAHPESVKTLNELLASKESECENTDSGLDSTETDIFGLSQLGCDELITEVNVPLLGQISVFSLNKDIPAQERYGLSSVDTCKLGKQSRMRIRAALEWLTQNEREGLTWGKLDGKALAIGFATDIPQRKIPLTRLFGGRITGEDVDAELSFENYAESVVSLLKGAGGSAKSNVALIILRKMDSKRVKVICDQVVSIEALEACSKEWSAGFSNVPDVSVREWPFARKEKRKDVAVKPQQVVPKSILPLRLHYLLNEVYKQNGESVVSVLRYSVADDAELFLGADTSGLALGMMEQYMRSSRGYFLTLCRELCAKDAKGFRLVTKLKFPGEHLGLLGLLLKKSNINKENYMKGIPYNLGRFLRIADELHALYCVLVRKNEMPPELCGSSLLLATMENPVGALQQLAMRSMPYVKWSQAFHGDKAGLVHYWRHHWSEIADHLAENDLPKYLTADEQAQLFLGFLSSFPKSGNEVDGNVNNETAKENQ